MSKKLKSLYKDIIRNKNLQENIPNFFNLVADNYHTYSAVRLALDYYTYYEMYCDEKEQWSSQLLDSLSKINKLISDTALKNISGKELEEWVEELDEIRNKIIARMNLLTSYTDLFQIYEYALNRVEYRFKEMEQLEDDEEYAKDVLRFIFNSEDNLQINEMIKEIIGQLPIRITKQKYFDYLEDGLYELLGVQEDVFETYIYMVRSSAILDFIDDEKDTYPNLWEMKLNLEKINFKNITKEEYEGAIDLIYTAGLFLERETTAYYILMGIVNDVYTILICNPYVGLCEAGNKEKEEAAFSIIRYINLAFTGGREDDLSRETLNSFELLEGFQEEAEYDLISLEDALYHISDKHRNLVEAMMADKLLNTLLLCRDLLSGSLFIDLHKEKSYKTIDKERLQKEVDKLKDDLSAKFQNCDRMIMRAIMANTLNKLPVFFKNHSEVMDYVLYSLNKCSDLAEKYACIEIINEMMNY
ncbi:hypothetical protein [Herbinix luporum]|jgi:hypothetical protein|uniref:Uncharacterized protein n=1 Tax=Herbinix luporum TaxID=1679721 RepID=A0A0K8J719_9FIRM|nr:hypothetical protein [Herbinix luporum]MDI9487787.1 hypothetical protein [Bacillota bacterium]CUH93219.1 hypothetical protein SD1D_1674 [Herbinix luporum]HHT57928.1 hypothetical protein [Herbinix luporum]